jgi:hypothetical protein
MPKKTKAALLTRHPSRVLRVDVLQYTTSGRLQACCWRAAQNRDSRLASGDGGATVRESVRDGLVQRPARVPGIDKGKLKIAGDFDKMSKSELAEWYGREVSPK